MAKLEVQLRTDDGDLMFKETIGEAMEEAHHDHSIWKVSWTDSTTGERVRLVRQRSCVGDIWVYEPIVV